MIDSLFIVTGSPRSGVAFAVDILRACGTWTEETLDGKNSRRLLGGSPVFRGLVKPFMIGLGADLTCQKPFANIDTVRMLAETVGDNWRGFVERAARRRGYVGGPWMYVGEEAATIWPVWRAAFPDAKWVVVRRHDADIVNACMRTTTMRKYSERGDWMNWLTTYKSRFSEIIDSGADVFQFWPQYAVDGNFGPVSRLMTELGLEWSRDNVFDSLVPALFKNNVYKITEPED